MTRHYFGTDGIRGRVGTMPITPDFVMRLGYAAGKVLAQAEVLGSGTNRPTVLIGKDTRISGYMLEAALEAGFAAGRRLPKEEAVQRYKGLGEMNADELWETTMNPQQRVLLQVTLDDAAQADEMFSVLMGEDVEARRNFIQQNARDVRFLDI